MSKATITGLIQFIRTQPEDRPVAHTGWSNCAVGDYAREVLKEKDEEEDIWDVVTALFLECGSIDVGYVVMFNIPWELSRDLKAPTVMDVLDNGGYGADTYGKLYNVLYHAETQHVN